VPAQSQRAEGRGEGFLRRWSFPSAFTAELLKVSFPKEEAFKTEKPSSADAPEVRFTRLGGDAIELARGRRGYVFRAFTSLPQWGGSDSGLPQWLDFDVSAFKEALKAIHQVDDKAKEREDERNLKLAQHKYQRGETKKWSGGAAGEDEQRPPVLAGDPASHGLRNFCVPTSHKNMRWPKALKWNMACTRARFVVFGMCESCGTRH
jgi:hypothetical protein